MEDRKSFYVTLPSKACHNIFPDNNSSDFTTMLSQPIELQGLYEVALAEIMYCHTWNNIVSLECTYDILDHDVEGKPPIYQKIKTGYYESVQQIVKEMNDVFTRSGLNISISYNSILKRVVVHSTKRFSLKLKAPIAYMLGFEPDEWVRLDKDVIAKYPCDIFAGQYNFMVYTNIVEAQHVGDFLVPLLRIVKIGGQYGDVVTLSYNKLHYVPVNKQRIQNIHIELKTDLNHLIRFTYGKTICKLHFRPVTNSLL